MEGLTTIVATLHDPGSDLILASHETPDAGSARVPVQRISLTRPKFRGSPPGLIQTFDRREGRDLASVAPQTGPVGATQDQVQPIVSSVATLTAGHGKVI